MIPINLNQSINQSNQSTYGITNYENLAVNCRDALWLQQTALCLIDD